MTKISMKSRQEVIQRYCARYKKSSKKEKGRILDYVCSATGLSRDRAKKLLCGRIKKAEASKSKKRGRKTKYGDSFRVALEKIWAPIEWAEPTSWPSDQCLFRKGRQYHMHVIAPIFELKISPARFTGVGEIFFSCMFVL